MKKSKFQKKLTISKETVVNLNHEEMQKQRGGVVETAPVRCSLETFCRTDCMISICVIC